MNCCVCNTNDWINVDKYRGISEEHKDIMPRDFTLMMCHKCGMVQYHTQKTEAEILHHYKHEARNAPTSENLFSAQYKVQYHNIFLGDLFRKWQEENKNAVIFDLGAAFGFFLAWIRKQLPYADVSGSEMTKTFVRVAWHEFGIRLFDDIDESKKYDFISLYKVHEHLMNPREKLIKYISLLKDDGYIYLGVPIYFEKMEYFGEPGFGLQGYYHTNHLNCWTRKNYESLLAQVGLKIIKQDHVLYDSVYLCQKTNEPQEITFDNPKEIETKMKNIYEAFEKYHNADYEGALKLFPNFPVCQNKYYEFNRNKLHKEGFDAIHAHLKHVLEVCPTSQQAFTFCVDVYQRYERFDAAQEVIDRALKINDCDPVALSFLQKNFRLLAMKTEDVKEKNELLMASKKVGHKLAGLSLRYKVQQIDTAFYDSARHLCPWEYSEK